MSQSAPAGGEAAYRLLDQRVEGEFSLKLPLPAKAEGEVRIAFDVVGPDDLSYVSLANGRIALFRVTAGAAKRVGEPRPVGASREGELTLQRRVGRARVILGGKVVLDEPWEGPLGGQVGVSAGSGVEPDALLLQPVEPPMFADDFTREESEMADWTTAGGTFRNTVVQAEGADPARSSNPFSLQVTTDGEALATAGLWFWDSYRAAVSVRPLTTAAVGISAYAQDDRNYVAFRWSAGDEAAPAARRLVLVRNGAEQTLAEARGGFLLGEWYRLELRVTPGRVEALVDRDPVLTAKTEAFGQGQVGLWAQKGTVVFDDALVTALDAPEVEPPEINPVFEADVEMAAQEIYLPRGLWRRTGTSDEAWNWGRFYKNATVTIPLQQVEGRELGVVFRPVLGTEAADTVLALAVVDGGLALRAEHGLRVEAFSHEPLQGDGPVSIELQGDGATVLQGGRALLTYTLPPSSTGREVALRNAAADATDQITVTSPHFLDYTFAEAPTDWYGGKGVWDVTSRWPCQPGWTFLGGTGNQNPVVWTKHGYRGDVVAEFYGAIRLDEELLRVTPYSYTHPSDINLTLCGDGKTLGTGYAFVLAGWDNTKSAILRNGKVVAERSDVIFQDPSTRDAFHHHWFRVRAEKIGDQVRFWVDGQPVLQYKDPEPLTGGRVGLWTFHNDLMVGRARLWYADEEQPGSVVRVPTLQADTVEPTPRSAGAAQVFDDFESGVGEWTVPADAPGALLALDRSTAAGGKSSLRVTNADEGGPFTVYPVTTPFRVSEWPVLSFDYRLTPGVKLNLYLNTNDTWHVVKLTANEPEASGVVEVGSVEGLQTDGKWHHVDIDLLALLQAKYPKFKVFQVKRLAICPPWDSYTRCGIGGNGRGTQYWIDNFRLGPRQ